MESDYRYLYQSSDTNVYGYGNSANGVRVYYDPPTLPLQAEYHVNLPNGVMLVDSQGRRTGKDPATGLAYHEIPGTEYGEDCLGETDCVGELITTDLPAGQYMFYVLGGSTGSFWLDTANNRGSSQNFSGHIQSGTMVSYTQNYSPAHFVSSSLSFQGAISSTASITSDPAHNIPLQPAPLPTVKPFPPPTSLPFYPAFPPGLTTSTSRNASSTFSSLTLLQIATSSTISVTSTEE